MATIVSTHVVGLEAVQKSLLKIGADAQQAIAAGLYQEAELVMTEAKKQVPVDTGTLKNSGHVQRPVISGDEISVTLGFGGAASDYALIQHEDLSLKHPHGGNAKYLERPFLASLNGLTTRLATRFWQRLGYGRSGGARGGAAAPAGTGLL